MGSNVSAISQTLSSFSIKPSLKMLIIMHELISEQVTTETTSSRAVLTIQKMKQCEKLHSKTLFKLNFGNMEYNPLFVLHKQ